MLHVRNKYSRARYLDPMLGMWISVDAARQYQNPYLYAGNNPIMRIDPDGNQDAQSIANAVQKQVTTMSFERFVVKPAEKINETTWNGISKTLEVEEKAAKYTLDGMSVVYPAAKPAVVALDALDGYLQNGSEGALTALACDAMFAGAGKFLPKNKGSDAMQAIASEYIGSKAQESVKDARMLREVDRSFDQKMIDYPTAPSDKTDVK